MKNIGEDPEIIEIMIDYGCYQYIPEKYRNDKKLTIRGIQQNKKVSSLWEMTYGKILILFSW